ncbi:PspC domain-containing protein [Sinomonas atrocyanea]
MRGLGLVRGRDRWMGGVASGLAQRWSIDPILVRGLFIVAAIFLGVGVLAYGLLWLLLPEPDGRIHAQEAAHGRWTAGMTGGLIVTVIGLGGARAGFWFGDHGIGGAFWGLFWVAVVGFGIYSIVRGSRRHTASRMAEAQRPGGTVPPAPPHPASDARQDSPFAAGVPSAGDAAYTKAGTPPSYGDTSSPQPGPAYSAAPHYAAPHYGPYVPAPTVVRPPRRPRASGPYVLVVLGAAALAAGSLGAVIATGAVPLAMGTIWTAIAVVLGLGILVAGLRGRRAGVLTLFAIVALVGSAASQGADRLASVRSSQVAFAPASLQEAARGYDVAMARGSLDLSGLDTARPLPSETLVPVKATMSDLTITVPKDVPVEVRTSTTLAAVTANGRRATGLSQHDTTTYNSGTSGPALVVELDATLSSVTVNEER